jgi:hypothetical protein
MAGSQASPDSETVSVRASDAQLVTGPALDTACTVAVLPGTATQSALQAVCLSVSLS